MRKSLFCLDRVYGFRVPIVSGSFIITIDSYTKPLITPCQYSLSWKKIGNEFLAESIAPVKQMAHWSITHVITSQG